MNKAYDGLEPQPLWRYFDMISQIPRGAGNEAGVQAAQRVGEVVSTHVIARPHANIDETLPLGRQEASSGKGKKG